MPARGVRQPPGEPRLAPSSSLSSSRWQKKLIAGDPDTRAELENLSLPARGREDERRGRRH